MTISDGKWIIFPQSAYPPRSAKIPAKMVLVPVVKKSCGLRLQDTSIWVIESNLPVIPLAVGRWTSGPTRGF